MLHLDSLPRTVELSRDGTGHAMLSYVDQRALPQTLIMCETTDWREVVDAITTLALRGAPALGAAGASAVVLWACNVGAAQAETYGCGEAGTRFLEALDAVADEIIAARPTAVNLAWGVEQIRALAKEEVAAGQDPGAVADILFARAHEIEIADESANRAIGMQGKDLLGCDARVLTHCNAGSLATVFYGTALGVVYAAAEEGRVARVYVDETRPVGQGARLTVWELARVGLPCTLICDNMAGSLMAQGEIDAVLVGADRIARNGDVANKIGTYSLAVLAHHHNIPFYVAAPLSTVDFNTNCGEDIPIEQRDSHEVLAEPLPGVEVWNPAFDVTPASLVTSIITERGVVRPDELACLLQ